VPEEITEVRIGKIIRDKYPDLSEEDQEAIRQGWFEESEIELISS
jgi:hypothetical protein